MRYTLRRVCLAAALLLALCLCAGAACEAPKADSMMDRQARRMLANYLSYEPSEKYVDDPENAFHFAGVRGVRLLYMITGEDTENKTETNYRMGACDLGFTANLGDTTYMFFGDTHVAHDAGSLQKHNAAAFTRDDDYTDGLTLEGMLMEEDGTEFREIILTNVSGVLEAASIPGGAVALGDTLYVSYMSVKYFTGTNQWPSNFGGFVKSADAGKTWERVMDMTWPGDSNFVQNCPVQVGDMVYVMGTGSARGTPMSLMRVPVARFEEHAAYEYLTGYTPEGEPVFEPGEDAMRRALRLVEDAGEMSILYSDYLQEWLVLYKPLGLPCIMAGKELWGPFSKPLVISDGANCDFYAPYGLVLNPRFVSEGGKKLGFLVSQYWPIYNVGMAELELMRK